MNPYIQSLRLRTLPLSMSGIVLGTGLAGWLDWYVFVLAICTTLSLQILSNLSNELGDAQKGTDSDQHGRAAYGLQAGTITTRQMKGMIGLFIGLCVVFGTALVLTAFRPWSSKLGEVCIFLVLGLLAIIGAMTYTLGKHSYGYMGLGDLGVFLFFGLLSTMGSYYLQAQTLTWEAFGCGVAIGLPCVGVLNLNNIRDMNNDRAHGKHTLASALGVRGAKIYHSCLLVGCLAIFMMYGHWWALCVLPVWAWHLWFVWNNEGKSLDRQMPVLMLSTGLLACIGWL
jgi:1,4-dihydroxy-2-naphthoate octaprenyltransferase